MHPGIVVAVGDCVFDSICWCAFDELDRQSHENDVDEHSSQCDTSARVLHAPLKRGKSLSPPQQARRQQLVASTNLGRYSSYRYVRPLSVARKQKILFRARLARSSPPTAEQSPVKSPKMTVKVEATETKTEEVNDDEDSEYSSLEDYDDSLGKRFFCLAIGVSCIQ